MSAGGAAVLGVGLTEVLGGEASLGSRGEAEQVSDDGKGELVEDLLVSLNLFFVRSRNNCSPGDSIDTLLK